MTRRPRLRRLLRSLRPHPVRVWEDVNAVGYVMYSDPNTRHIDRLLSEIERSQR